METITELQITGLHTGTGKEASKGALLTAHDEGALQDGSVFDSSHVRGRPIEFVVGTGRVIQGWDQGWDQGLIGMREGGKRKLVIPAHLFEGSRICENGRAGGIAAPLLVAALQAPFTP
jgi:peptidylprolyl isomerase